VIQFSFGTRARGRIRARGRRRRGRIRARGRRRRRIRCRDGND